MRLGAYVLATVGAIALATSVSASGYYGNDQSGTCYASPGSQINVHFPLYPDKFPNTTQGSPQDEGISQRAGGTYPHTPLPNTVNPDTITSIQLIIQTEYYVVAYIYQLLNYITNNVPGYSIQDSSERSDVIADLTSQMAQSERHALSLNYVLERYGVSPVRTCAYIWPATVTDYTSAIYTLALFADSDLGMLQVVIQLAASNGDFLLLPSLSALAQNVAERTGVIRSRFTFTPSANPFPSPVTRELVYSTLIHQLIVPGSCPDGDTINLELFGALVLSQPPSQCSGVDQVIEFSVKGTDVRYISGLYIAYVNQQNLPVVVTVQNPQVQGGCVVFSAVFPCSLLEFGAGLTIAGLVNSTGPFRSVSDLFYATSFAPATIYLS